MGVMSVRWPARRRSMFAAAFLILSPVCLPTCKGGDTGADRTLSTRLWTEYLAVVKGVQADKVAAWYTKDAVIILPDTAELRGRDAIRAYLLKAYQGLKVLDLTFMLDRVEVVGGRAYTFGTVTEVIQEGAAPQTKLQARCAAVWEQQPDMTWQIAHFLVNFLTL